MKVNILFKIMTLSTILAAPYLVDLAINIDSVDEEYTPVAIENEVAIPSSSLIEEKRNAVRFTSYWVGDGSSADTTSSGLNSKDFEVNENGWYTYQNKVVLAAATDICLEAKTGACGKYNELPEGYNLHSLYDELTIYVDEVAYDAIILDSCGASFWQEEYQRYDLYISSDKYLTDIKGYVEIEQPEVLRNNS